jgi:hypothetical protein
MGARVVVTPGEISPAKFSHPLLPVYKIAPQPAAPAEAETNDPVGAKADKRAPDTKAAPTEAKPDLRATIGHQDEAQPPTNAVPASLRAETHTADASDEARAPKIMSDAAPAGASAEGGENAAKTPPQPAAAPVAETPAKTGDNTLNAAGAQAGQPADKTQATGDADKANDAKKDQTRLVDPKRDVPRRGQIAVFISRKDSKLYVRQNFEPLFDAPVTIAASDRPLGTHVFTAEVDKTDPNALHWSVVSLPSRSAKRVDDEERPLHRHKAAASDARPIAMSDNPAEALDRISIPAETMARIADALTNGGSIIVSDQGINQGETGEGTDFIVSLR